MADGWKPIPGGASADELKQLREPIEPGEGHAKMLAALQAMTAEERREWNTAREQAGGPVYPHLIWEAIEEGQPLVRFVALLWVDPNASIVTPLVASGYVGRTDDELAIVQLTVEPDPTAPAPLNSTALRAVARDSAKILAKVRARLLGDPELMDLARRFGLVTVTAEEREAAQRLAEAAAVLPRKRRGGRQRYPDDHYRRVALRYLDLQEHGVQRGILVRLAEIEGVPRDTVRDWVHGATKRGFLTPGKQGRAGRDAGPNLYRKEEQ